MLTTEKIEKLKRKIGKTKEEKIICFLWEAQGVLKLDELVKLMKEKKETVMLHVRKSFLLSMSEGIVKLERKGINKRVNIFVDSFDAESIDSFVYSELDKNNRLLFDEIKDKVIQFCKIKELNVSGFLRNPNIFQTQKKTFSSYRKALDL